MSSHAIDLEAGRTEALSPKSSASTALEESKIASGVQSCQFPFNCVYHLRASLTRVVAYPPRWQQPFRFFRGLFRRPVSSDCALAKELRKTKVRNRK